MLLLLLWLLIWHALWHLLLGSTHAWTVSTRIQLLLLLLLLLLMVHHSLALGHTHGWRLWRWWCAACAVVPLWYGRTLWTHLLLLLLLLAHGICGCRLLLLNYGRILARHSAIPHVFVMRHMLSRYLSSTTAYTYDPSTV